MNFQLLFDKAAAEDVYTLLLLSDRSLVPLYTTAAAFVFALAITFRLDRGGNAFLSASKSLKLARARFDLGEQTPENLMAAILEAETYFRDLEIDPATAMGQIRTNLSSADDTRREIVSRMEKLETKVGELLDRT